MLSPDITEILFEPDIGGGQMFTAIRTVVSRTLVSESNQVTRTECKGNIQPANAEDLQQLTDEARRETVIVVRSTYPFQLGSDGSGGSYTLPDELEYNGHRYKVNRVDDWSAWGFTTAWAVLRRDVTL